MVKVTEDRTDPIFIECVKSLMKVYRNFNDSIEIWKVPEIYRDRISIGTTNSLEHICIKEKLQNEPNPCLVQVYLCRTISKLILDSYGDDYNINKNVMSSKKQHSPDIGTLLPEFM